MLNLYVWGAAFGLPSIDAECLAIITYLHNAPPNTPWRLIPSHNASISPSHLLPALDHDGAWSSGYQSIINYLISKSLCPDLDAGLSASLKADGVAYRAHLAAHAAPLLDLSLYVSAANWSATTRPAYSDLLSFPLTWTAVPLIRAAAIKRVEHLGLADLDVDFDPNSAFHLSAGRETLPETFRKHLPSQTIKTVRDEMTPEQASAIRLFGLAADGLSVFEALLVENKVADKKSLHFFGGDGASSLDCLAYGYCALMKHAPVPRPFIRDWLEANCPHLARFIDDKTSTMATQLENLPWSTAEPSSILSTTARVTDTLIRNIPSIGEHYASEVRFRAENSVKGLDRRSLVLTMGLLTTGTVVGYGLYMYRAMQPFGLRTQMWAPHGGQTKLGDFGEIGSILNSALSPIEPARYAPPAATAPTPSGRLVEADSELD